MSIDSMSEELLSVDSMSGDLYTALLAIPLMVGALALVVFIVYMAIRPPVESGIPFAPLHRREQTPVIAYKSALLTTDGFCGVSGGGDYGYVSEGKLNPGFHGFRSLDLLRKSQYRGDVVLEVLLYGEVNEYSNGYVGSHQRVLQVITNQMDSGALWGCCIGCYRSSSELFVDRNADALGKFRAHLWCRSCMKLSKLHSMLTFQLSLERGRYEPLKSFIERRNSESSNKYPVGFVSKLDDLVPTELPKAPSASIE